MNEYNSQLSKLKNICKNLKKAPHYLDLSQKYNLRSSRWFISHCKNPKVVDYNTFMEYEVGVLPNYNCSKEKIIDIINNYFKKNKKQVTRKILETEGIEISLGTIKRIFGSLRNMNEELGYKILTKGGIDKKKSLVEIKEIISIFFENLNSKNFSRKEFNMFCEKNNLQITFQTVENRLRKEEGISFRNYSSENFGIFLQEAGRGIIRTFPDGEKCLSDFEFIFSSYIRNIGFKYNKDYYREIKYSELFSNVKRNIDMDYYFPEYNLVIEIAGILRDYERFFIENEKIKSSKSKEEYRLSLLEKKEILETNGVIGYFIFPNKYKKFENIINETNIF
jgi:hypothetical protein